MNSKEKKSNVNWRCKNKGVWPLTSRMRSGLRLLWTTPSGLMFHSWLSLPRSGETQIRLPAIITLPEDSRKQSSTTWGGSGQHYQGNKFILKMIKMNLLNMLYSPSVTWTSRWEGVEDKGSFNGRRWVFTKWGSKKEKSQQVQNKETRKHLRRTLKPKDL